MRWNMLFGALVVSAGLCGQSFGFELLERMLGLDGCDGNGCASDCCDTPCGAAEPSCGCEPACDAAACCEPACDAAAACCEPACDAAPSCGCKKSCGCKSHCGGGLLDGLFSHHGHGCCKSSCGCKSHCGKSHGGCGRKCGGCKKSCGCKSHCGGGGCGLLDGLFSHHGHGCCKSSCGCGDNGGCGCNDGCGGSAELAPADGGEAAPMPPAPMADPSASLRSNRRLVHATSIVRRK